MRRMAPYLLTALLLAGCAAPVVDRTAGDFDQDAYERALAHCNGGSVLYGTAKSIGVAVWGSFIGAAHGAVYGGRGHRAEVALVGAVAGGVVGMSVGAADALKEHDGEVADCLREKGYAVIADGARSFAIANRALPLSIRAVRAGSAAGSSGPIANLDGEDR